MSSFNPYQGWAAPSGTASGSRPSIYGALPFPGPPSNLPTLFAFRFTSFAPTILNCIVIGPAPQSRPYFRILTDAPMAGVTVFQNAGGNNFALCQWHRHPEVEIRGVVPRQQTRNMLSLTEDQSARTMTATHANGSTTMTFIPRDNFIWIYSNAAEPELLGRISRSSTSVTLELTGEAIHIGLLEPVVVATFLLQCGRTID
ncbi:hypothetical protein HMN09_00943400 [Mycena chlorophos]|uniref:Uncharacterized protein n=1 Tax=Mycena chlorophos TaxID=658473 RepID=A0A8H6W036_MYCCL|nr:hypothetical protein HMN09_00943400 [Mycena chlorophos]